MERDRAMGKKERETWMKHMPITERNYVVIQMKLYEIKMTAFIDHSIFLPEDVSSKAIRVQCVCGEKFRSREVNEMPSGCDEWIQVICFISQVIRIRLT